MSTTVERPLLMCPTQQLSDISQTLMISELCYYRGHLIELRPLTAAESNSSGRQWSYVVDVDSHQWHNLEECLMHIETLPIVSND